MQKKRISYYDNCKFILIILVVVGHFIEQSAQDASTLYRTIFLFIYSFHMPAFFFLSGLFDSPRTDLSRRVNKGVYYLSLYVLLKCVITVIKFAFTGTLSFDLFKEAGIPWFCLALGVFTILTGVLRRAGVNLKVLMIINILLACFVGIDKSIGDYLCISRIIYFYPYYLLGTAVTRDGMESALKNRFLRAAGYAVLGGYLAVCYVYIDRLYSLRALFSGRNAFKDAIMPYGPLVRLACYGITVLIGFAFLMIVPRMSLGFLSAFGQRTMQIYFWHRPILYVLCYLHVHTTVLSFTGGLILWMLCGAALTFVLTLKPFGFPVTQLSRWLQQKKAS